VDDKKVLIVLGPTCVGKTSLSLLLAERMKTEIVSADSMQVYRGMDVGTAKPTAQERARVRHHMLDMVEPHESYSSGRYVTDVVPVIELLFARGMTPLVVGGSGLYIRAMTAGIFSAPDADWPLRRRLMAMEDRRPGSLHEYLGQLDPDAAEKLMPADARRIVRALEVCIISGEPVSRLRRELTAPMPYRFIKIGLTRDRAELYPMIEERVDWMFSNGLAEEVRRLLLKNPSRTPMQAIGYKETAMHVAGEISIEEAAARVKQATRNYAKRQISWFKNEPDVHWVDVTGVTEPPEILERVISAIPPLLIPPLLL
jgi:tRNA dimethylallyltransferase